MFTRRCLLAASAAAATTLASVSYGKSNIGETKGPKLAVTIDDYKTTDTILLSAQDRDLRIRNTLDQFGIKAAGFISGFNIDSEDGARLLSKWSNQGHILCNHSYSHKYYGNGPAEEFMRDVLRCEKLLTPYPAFQKLFRFPYLGEGKTIKSRDTMRKLLLAHGYRNGHVTIDASDWYINDRLIAKRSIDPKADFVAYRNFYCDHLWARAQYYDGLAQKIFGHSISHSLLVHHNDTSALFLGDALAMFKRRGWGLLDAKAMFATPELQQQYDTIPSGQSLLWAAAKAKGVGGELRYPGEDGVYEGPKMDALGL
jgi:peptidoglycan-N-acetylglucosamine deacetylase